MHPVLSDLIRQLDSADADARALVGLLTEEEAYWRPSKSQWSVAECLEHIAISAEMYLRSIDRALASGWPSENGHTPGELRYGLVSRWLVKNIEPPPKTRIKTGRAYLPKGKKKLHEVLRRYLDGHQAVRQRIRAANGLDLVRTRVGHPSMPLLRFSLGAAFAILTGHARRHLWQAHRVVEHPSFGKVAATVRTSETTPCGT